MRPFSTLRLKHKGPTGKKPVEPNDSNDRCCCQAPAGNVSDLPLSMQLAYPTLSDSPSTEVIGFFPVFAEV